MNTPFQNEMQCSQFEALLAEALDGTLSASLRPAFDAHSTSCPACGPMLAEAREGILLLGTLREVEPPKNLVHNILAATTMAETRAHAGTAPARVKAGWLKRLFPAPTGTARKAGWAGVLHSRFVTSFCMAFFSLSLTLSLAGVKISDLAKIDWHPTALRKSVVLQYTQIEAKVTRYYDNMRLVVEVESRVRDLKRAANPVPDKTNDNKQRQNRNAAPDTSGRPQEQENYSQERDGSMVARSMMRSEGAEI